MLHGLVKLTWLETKIFVREPMGVIGTIGVPVLLFAVLGRLGGGRTPRPGVPGGFAATTVPIFIALLISLGAVLSLVTIVSIYRESGILKRLRATPLRPLTILAAHVMVKLLLTAVALFAMMAVGARAVPLAHDAHPLAFLLALLISTFSLLSIGFIIASLVPTARFAQPIGSLVFYPMIPVSGLFVPIEVLPPALQTLSRFVPLTYVVSLLRGIWLGDPWTAHAGDVAALGLLFVGCTAIAARVFRWE